jgi:hypothetical protein
MKILVRKRSDDYLAQVQGQRGVWACGDSAGEIIRVAQKLPGFE